MRANYFMEFKLAMVEKYLQPGVSVAMLARNNGINDHLLFKWRRRYRHLADALVDESAGTPVIIEDNIVPALVEHTPALLPPVSPAPATQPKPGQVCELAIGRARLKLSGYITLVMLAMLVRELKKGRPMIASGWSPASTICATASMAWWRAYRVCSMTKRSSGTCSSSGSAR